MTTESLYVVKRTFVDPKNPAEPTFNVALPATFTDLKAAKNEARATLIKEGYDPDFFSEYDVNDNSKEWKHGDGVVVYAQGPADELFKVEINTVPKSFEPQADSTGRVQTPLYHVLQTIIEYDSDRSGSQRYSIVEGTYTSSEIAQEEGLRVLLDGNVTKEDFVEYNEYLDGAEGPFGADVIIHAVKEGGQNVLVSVISNR